MDTIKDENQIIMLVSDATVAHFIVNGVVFATNEIIKYKNDPNKLTINLKKV